MCGKSYDLLTRESFPASNLIGLSWRPLPCMCVFNLTYRSKNEETLPNTYLVEFTLAAPNLALAM